jgi:hypothetical protein
MVEGMLKQRVFGTLFACCVTVLFLAMAAGPVLAAGGPGKISGIYGYVTDAQSGLPVGGVLVTDLWGRQCYTDVNGLYGIMEYKYDTYTITASKNGWIAKSARAVLKSPYGEARVDFNLAHQTGFYGRVTSDTGATLAGAHIKFYLAGTNYDDSFADSWGWYWDRPVLWGQTYESDCHSADGWPWEGGSYWAVFHHGLHIHSNQAILNNFVLQTNMRLNVPVAAIYCTLLPTTHVQMEITIGSGGSQTVSFNVVGGGGSSSQSWQTTSTFMRQDTHSLVVKRWFILSGYYDTGDNEFMPTITWTNDYFAEDTQSDYSSSPCDANYHGINTITDPPTCPSGKGGTDGGVAANQLPLWGNFNHPIFHTASSSVTFTLGQEVTMPVLSVYGSISMGASASFTKTSTNNLLVTLWNLDTVTHKYKWYLEGTSTSEGGILHVWDMGQG